MPSLKYKTSKFHQRNFREEISAELDSGRQIQALFICHGYVEAFLRELLVFETSGLEEKITRNMVQSIESLRFPNLLLAHFFAKSLDAVRYACLEELNDFRNKFAH